MLAVDGLLDEQDALNQALQSGRRLHTPPQIEQGIKIIILLVAVQRDMVGPGDAVQHRRNFDEALQVGVGRTRSSLSSKPENFAITPSLNSSFISAGELVLATSAAGLADLSVGWALTGAAIRVTATNASVSSKTNVAAVREGKQNSSPPAAHGGGGCTSDRTGLQL